MKTSTFFFILTLVVSALSVLLTLTLETDLQNQIILSMLVVITFVSLAAYHTTRLQEKILEKLTT